MIEMHPDVSVAAAYDRLRHDIRQAIKAARAAGIGVHGLLVALKAAELIVLEPERRRLREKMRGE